jgi:eukaryotic-like serine/threonine-protein kinase
MLDIAEGTIVAEKYRVERVLGVGGMGIVVAAMHLHLEERVAIKFLLPEVAVVPEAVARFTREARIAAKIKGEHVAKVLDVALLADGTPYLVMEYLVGTDLAGRLQSHGPLPVHDAVTFMLQACEALAEAHTLGIVHRDLKPANLFVATRPDGSPALKILDFGISKLTSSSGTSGGHAMTRTTAIMGSPNYMSPEQLKSARDVDARADIWALGASLFEVLTGRVPFEAEELPQLCTMILYSEPYGLRDLKPDLPPELQAVLSRCLAKDRALRYQHVLELATDLARFGPPDAHRSVERIARVFGSAYPASVPSQPSVVPHQAQVTGVTWGQTQSPPSSRLAPLLIGAALALGAVAAAAFFFLRSTGEATAEPAASGVPSVVVAPPPPPEAVAVVPPTPPPVASPVVPETAAPPVTSAPAVAATPAPAPRPRTARPAARPKPAPAPAPAPAPVAPAPAKKQPAALSTGID